MGLQRVRLWLNLCLGGKYRETASPHLRKHPRPTSHSPKKKEAERMKKKKKKKKPRYPQTTYTQKNLFKKTTTTVLYVTTAAERSNLSQSSVVSWRMTSRNHEIYDLWTDDHSGYYRAGHIVAVQN